MRSSFSGWITVFLAVCLVSGAGLRAGAAPVDGGQAVVDLITDHTTVTPGQTFRVALTLDIDDHWHVYWKNPGDSGLPPEIVWNEGQAFEVGGFIWPAPSPQPIETLMNYGFEGQLILPFDITVPETATGELVLSGSAQYLICKDICIPEDAPVFLRLPVGDTPVRNSSSDALFTEAASHTPIDFEGEAVIDRSGDLWKLSLASDAVRAALDADIRYVRFFPADHQIEHFPEQPVSLGDKGITLDLHEAVGLGEEGDLSGVLVLEDMDANRIAFDLTASPGKVMAGTNGTLMNAGSGPSEMIGIGALIGILAAALLGGAILNLMPCVLPVLFIKARSLIDLAGEQDRDEVRRHGLFYAFGVVACFVGFGIVLALLRSAGETAGLGFQLQYPPVIAGLALLMFVLGLNMMGWFETGSSLMGIGSGLAEKGGNKGAFFTGVLAAFVGAPCIGPFIGAATGVVVTQPVIIILLVFAALGLGMALPFLMVTLFPGMLSALPQPGAWMERLKQFFAFPLFLTAIWLLWVLGNQAGVGAVSLVAIAAVLLVFAIWMMKSAPEAGAGKSGAVGLAVAAILGAIAITVSLSGATVSEVAETEAGYDGAWSQTAVQSRLDQGRGVFIDFTASWCVTCQVNKRTTLHTKRIKELFEAENIDFLVADWTRRDKLIADELAKHGRAGVPLYLYYPPGQSEPVILPQVLSQGLVVSIVRDNVS